MTVFRRLKISSLNINIGIRLSVKEIYNTQEKKKKTKTRYDIHPIIDHYPIFESKIDFYHLRILRVCSKNFLKVSKERLNLCSFHAYTLPLAKLLKR